jgi:hypothetical protein
MRRSFFSVVASVLGLAGSANAGQLSKAPVLANFGGPGNYGASAGNFSPIVKPVASYCRQHCDIWRKDCYNAYRANCFGYECRK